MCWEKGPLPSAQKKRVNWKEIEHLSVLVSRLFGLDVPGLLTNWRGSETGADVSKVSVCPPAPTTDTCQLPNRYRGPNWGAIARLFQLLLPTYQPAERETVNRGSSLGYPSSPEGQDPQGKLRSWLLLDLASPTSPTPGFYISQRSN